MTAQDAAGAEVDALDGAVSFDGLLGIGTACWLKAACVGTQRSVLTVPTQDSEHEFLHAALTRDCRLQAVRWPKPVAAVGSSHPWSR